MTQQSYPIQELNLVFLDPTVLNIQSLIASVKPDSQVFILDSTKDGIAQISEYLQTNPLLQEGGVIKSIHLVSHGTNGSLQLGSKQLNSHTIKSYEKDLQHWKKVLSDDADILLYGCNVGFGEEGKAFILQLSQLTGADIAASDDLTGNPALGGDWNLEVATGLIEESLAFSSEAMAGYSEVLSQFVVTNTNDSGIGSLRQAILNSNSITGTQDILFSLSAGAMVNLTSALPSITDSVNIVNSTGASNLTIRRNSGGEYGIFTINSGQTVNIQGLTLTNGSREFGGGIYNEGTLALANSIISDNHATQTGGGIYNKGTLTVTNTAIVGNTAQIVGGGIGAAAPFSIANSTISGNTAKFGGGAIGDVVASGTINISNTTIYNNFSNAGGGGIDLITLTVNIKNSILAGNNNDDGEQNFAAPGDGSIQSLGYNIESGTDAGFTSTGDLQNTDPLLAPLADNGGSTLTHALLPGSPAINTGDNTGALTTDQRGNSRIADGTVDIGAFEVSEEASSNTLVGTDGNDDIFGIASSETIFGKLGSDNIDAAEGEDTIFGDEITPTTSVTSETNDLIRGGHGSDRIFGGEGDDNLYGDAGNDMIWGNDGVDLLWGGEGNDYLTGGQGHDIFVVASNEGIDTINDFQEYDIIGLTGGLTYAQLSITQILDNSFISESSTQKILAILTGVQASTLMANRFQEVTLV